MAQDRSPLTAYLLFLLLTATIGPLLFGYHLAELNAPSDVLTCTIRPAKAGALSRIASAAKEYLYKSAAARAAKSETLAQCIEMNATQFGIVSSFFTLGGLVGALAAGPISGRTGRVRSMLYAAAFATIGPMFEALAPNIGTMATGRLIAGLGAGMAMVVTPIYIFDIAPPGRKGFFGSFTQVMINVGILITQVLGYFMSKGQMWRVILGIGGAISLAQALGLLFAGQESPKYLAEHGRPTQAKRVLQKIRGGNADIAEEVAAWGHGPLDLDDEEARLLANNDTLQDEIRATSPARNASVSSATNPMSFFEVLRHPDTRPAVIAITGVMIAQQFTGINSIVMYGVSLLSSLLESNSALLNVFVSALNIITTTCAAPMVEKLGRKTCLLISISGMGSMSVLLAIGIMKSIPILSAVAVMVFVSSFGLGLGPVPFLLPSEFVDSTAVGAVQSWALAVNWTATFLVSMCFPILNEKMGKGQVYFLFAGFALVLGAFIAWYVPESKGKSDPDEVWGRRKGRRASD